MWLAYGYSKITGAKNAIMFPFFTVLGQRLQLGQVPTCRSGQIERAQQRFTAFKYTNQGCVFRNLLYFGDKKGQ